ncbi:poly(A) polymerase [Moraxella macacae 0408225]|uniref:Poly(A) polymerase I n=1 Tax=Moraxella macacae 0408225 TaxID=1230338 RepID=L2F8L6_9GAMM|nr:polynucleotide adenylyltransferase PcnB [Moraxella macacae]ELA09245.1 poly(A) polymerase [Moraxella macacae 0408225]
MTKKSTAKKTKIRQNSDQSLSVITDRKQACHDAKNLGLHKGYLPSSIKEVILTLNQAGFEAYIVGGGVRDALLGLEPKDFDAVTNATPTQIKAVFGKRCRIIGKRFLLCHVYSGRDLIEVATFRGQPTGNNHTNNDGMIVRDNVWGDILTDVVRRDFSINALYYQPLEGVLYDFCNGLNDLHNRTLRLLGDTKIRIEEDPVRLLRALRFKAKLNFKFDKSLEKQFCTDHWALLSQVSPHRLYDETIKLFSGGYLMNLLPLLYDYKAFDALLFYPPNMMTPLVEQVALNTDKRIQSGKTTNPAFFYATLLWENYLFLLNKHRKKMSFNEAQIFASNLVLDRQRQRTAMPKFAENFIKDIWLMQSKLVEPRKKNLLKILENQNFRAGFDFLLLREQVFAKNQTLLHLMNQTITLDNESTHGMGHWWAWFQTLNPKQREQAIHEFDSQTAKQRFANLLTTNDSFEATDNKKSKKGKLTEQQQREREQLQQLSLVNQPTKTYDYFANIEKMLEVSNSQHQEKRNTKACVNKQHIASLVQDIPAERKHRKPSSTLSLLDKKRGFTESNKTTQTKNKRSVKIKQD